MDVMHTLKQSWAENLENRPAVNLAVGGLKMIGAIALTTLAGIRFGTPALAVGTTLSLAELADLKWGAKEDETTFHEMGTSFAGRKGLRSLHKGIQYATIGLLIAKLSQGVVRRDFSTASLLKMGAYGGGAVVAAVPTLLTAYGLKKDWEGYVPRNSFDDNPTEQKVLLWLGLTYDPIPWESNEKD